MAGCLAGTLLGLEAGVLTFGLVPVCFPSAGTLGIEPRDAAVVGVEPIVLVTEEGATKDLEPEALGIEPNLGGLVAALGILYCTFFSFYFTSLAFLLSFQPLGSFTTHFATPFTSLFLYWGLMSIFLKST